MRSAYVLAPALLLALAPAAPADGPTGSSPLYSPVLLYQFFLQPQYKEELKLTKDQEQAARAALDKPPSLSDVFGEASKYTGPDKTAKERELLTKHVEENFKALEPVLTPGQIKRMKQVMLQWWGMNLFEHPEIRADLKLGDGDVRKLKAAWEKLKKDAERDAVAKRLSPRAAEEKYFRTLAYGVPDGVRQLLTEKQRQKLYELLGEDYRFAR